MLEFLCHGQGSVGSDLMRLINSSTKLFAWLIQYRCSDRLGVDAQSCLVSVGNVDTDTISMPLVWLWRIESLCHRLYQCQYAGSKECGWDGTSCLLPWFLQLLQEELNMTKKIATLAGRWDWPWDHGSWTRGPRSCHVSKSALDYSLEDVNLWGADWCRWPPTSFKIL